jgi:hypothetical protein
MEALSEILFANVNQGFFLGFSIGFRHSGVVSISYLLFVDDTLIFFFCGANPDYLRYLVCLIFML